MLQNERREANVSQCRLRLHLIGFLLFIVSQVGYLALTYSETIEWDPRERTSVEYLFADSLNAIGTFLVQFLIALVSYRLAAKRKQPTNHSLDRIDSTPVVEDFSEEDELQGRIWHQFIRDDLTLSTAQSEIVDEFLPVETIKKNSKVVDRNECSLND